MTLACALQVEERAARKGGARAARVGLGASLPLPGGSLVAFGLAGALVDDLEPGTLLSATRLVSEDGEILWEGDPVEVDGARPAVILSTDRVVDDPDERRRLAERTGALAVEMESAELAATGRLAGSVRAISDTPGSPLGCLTCAAHADGSTNWTVVAKSVLTEPVKTARAVAGARRGLAALEHAAASLDGAARG